MVSIYIHEDHGIFFIAEVVEVCKIVIKLFLHHAVTHNVRGTHPLSQLLVNSVCKDTEMYFTYLYYNHKVISLYK